MECIRRLLRRSGEALRLLQLLQQHHIGRLAQTLDKAQCHELAQLTFHQLVCSAEGEEISTRLVAALMEVQRRNLAVLCINHILLALIHIFFTFVYSSCPTTNLY